jgi:hypothetical protein
MGSETLTDDDGKVLPGWGTYQTRYKYWGKVYDAEILKGTDMSRYERMEREHDARQPFVKRDLLQALESNVYRSYRQLSKHIHKRLVCLEYCGGVAEDAQNVPYICKKH